MFRPLSSSAVLIALIFSTLSAAAQTRHAASPHASAVEATGPSAIFDTSSGRIMCRLYSKQAPATVENFIVLAQGTKDWADSSGVVQQGKPFYDGTQVFGMTGGIMGGDRKSTGTGNAGPATPPEKTGLDTDRAGRLVAVVDKDGESSSVFGILPEATSEMTKRSVVFGQCDQASIEVARAISHELLSTDNHPAHPVVLRKVMIVAEGQPMPAPAAPMPNEATLTVAPLSPPAADSPQPTGPTVVMETSKGMLTCKLFSKEAPIGVANFVGLAQGTKPYRNPATRAEVRGKHYYDGLSFARVIPDYMIQNADMPGGLRSGDIGIKFDNEIVPGLTFDRPGRLAYANAGPGTNESEFFITEHPVHRLDGSYTIFGQCDDDSVKVVEGIARAPRDLNNKPLTPVMIKHITIQPAQ